MATIEVLELVGVSDRSWHDAVNNALEEANQSVRNISGIDVLDTTAKVSDGKIAEDHANLKVAFRVET